MSDVSDPVERIDDGTAQIVYRELGEQHDRIDAVLSEYKEQGLTHTESFKMLEQRAARFRLLRGILQEITDVDLSQSTNEKNNGDATASR